MSKFDLKLLIFTFIMGAMVAKSYAQFSVSGEFRFNPAYSRGFRQAFTENDKAGAYMHQRSRLITEYTRKNDLALNITLQDWRVWGDQNIRKDQAEITLFRGWVQKWFTENLSVRLGRQKPSYDDQQQ